MNDPCSANCDRDYLLFLSSKRVLKSKLATCLKSSSSKAQDACYTDAIKDLRSLDKFIIRTKSSELTTIQSAPSTQQKWTQVKKKHQKVEKQLNSFIQFARLFVCTQLFFDFSQKSTRERKKMPSKYISSPSRFIIISSNPINVSYTHYSSFHFLFSYTYMYVIQYYCIRHSYLPDFYISSLSTPAHKQLILGIILCKNIYLIMMVVGNFQKC